MRVATASIPRAPSGCSESAIRPTAIGGGRRTYAENGGWESATYKYSWATKNVGVKPYQYSGRTYLRVRVHTDFTPADGRQNYTTDVWVLK